MPLTWARTVAAASTATSTAVAVTSVGFGIAKASTKFAFSIARSIASVAPIPFLDASITHLENLSLLPILLGESITSTSLVAASTSLDLISNLFQAEDEASFSLATFVSLVRREWAEHEAAGRSVTAVARAVAAWAAIQGFTKQWSEERWLKHVRELTHNDFHQPDKQRQRKRSRHNTISRVSVTEDLIMSGHSGQVVSADIGEKEETSNDLSADSFQASSPSQRQSNYETWKTLRRLSKMVLAGYGGAGLLFFGVPLRPDGPTSSPSPTANRPQRTETEVKDSEEKILLHAVEDAEAEAMSPPMPNVMLPDMNQAAANQKQSSSHPPAAVHPASSSAYSWWNVLLGKHDREIFEGFAFTPADESDRASTHSAFLHTPSFLSQTDSRLTSFPNSPSDIPASSRQQKGPRPPTAMIGDLSKMPRFWVLTDHSRRQVVLVLRGTMSYYELAVDLHCEPEDFELATATSSRPERRKESDSPPAPVATHGSGVPFPTIEDHIEGMPGSFRVKPAKSNPASAKMSSESSSNSTTPRPSIRRRASIFDLAVEPSRAWPTTSERGDGNDDDESTSQYQVHGGILQLARLMGSQGKPVHEAVRAALARNRGYELVLCGHSLGAGVASLLGLMWADPLTCRTVSSSGLPANRRVSVYCFAPPCIASPALSTLCRNLTTSIVYSFDVVSRLSLGSVRDLNKAAYWLCEGQGEESASSVLHRALRGNINFTGSRLSEAEEDKRWFIALRKTLEANMTFAHLFPPGRVWWAVRDEALHPSHRRGGQDTGIRLFEVLDVERVFQQIEFKGDMLSSHLPHQYDRILTELGI